MMLSIMTLLMTLVVMTQNKRAKVQERSGN